MSIKDAALRYATAVENEPIQIRADQMEQGRELTDRINRVPNDVKMPGGGGRVPRRRVPARQGAR